MASPKVEFRCGQALLQLVRAAADKAGHSLSEEIVNTLAEKYLGYEAEPHPEPAAPKPVPRRPAAAVAPKLDVAREALAGVAQRVGVKLDTSMVPVHDGSKRPPYQRQSGRKAGGR